MCPGAHPRSFEEDASHRSFRRIVLKVGTSTLTGGSAVVDPHRLAMLADDVAAAIRRGREVLVVSSGAIVTGTGLLGLRRPAHDLAQKQALAAVGQPLLMQHYAAAFDALGLRVGQVLLTQRDFAIRHRYVNARRTLEALLALGVIPIINENDTIATDEIQIGDNDTLSALVASLVGADLLVILSDVEGLMTADPRRHRDAHLIPVVPRIDATVLRAARRTPSAQGVGGMATKISAARTATLSGVVTVITSGVPPNPLARLLEGERHGTMFLPARRPASSRRRWLALGLPARGALVIDDGARAALERGKSLLAAGIVDVQGTFEPGEAVVIRDTQGAEIARGVSSYPSGQVAQIMGIRSAEIARVLGVRTPREVVHRDNLVLTSRK
ncbi:MAG TPA: glutamate 5-kinase [bacterium]|nr:glutamate 5-kinase [bacterium]